MKSKTWEEVEKMAREKYQLSERWNLCGIDCSPFLDGMQQNGGYKARITMLKVPKEQMGSLMSSDGVKTLEGTVEENYTPCDYSQKEIWFESDEEQDLSEM